MLWKKKPQNKCYIPLTQTWNLVFKMWKFATSMSKQFQVEEESIMPHGLMGPFICWLIKMTWSVEPSFSGDNFKFLYLPGEWPYCFTLIFQWGNKDTSKPISISGFRGFRILSGCPHHSHNFLVKIKKMRPREKDALLKCMYILVGFFFLYNELIFFL